MRSKMQFSAIDAHSAGAQARVVLSGVPFSPGATIAEKRSYLARHHDDVRKLLMYEPRGGAQMSGSIIVPPCDSRADVGIIFIESGGWLTMCGAGTIGAATVLVEAGMVAVTEPATRIVFDTPAGLVTAKVDVQDGAARGVTIENVPSFLALRDYKVELSEYGEVAVDISYGGNFYIIVPASRFGLKIEPGFADRLVDVGRKVRGEVNKSLKVQHPLESDIRPIPNVIFTEEEGEGGAYRNMVLFGEAGVDRSPGGTGTSARMAQRFYRGLQAIGDVFRHESIIGSTFEGTLIREEKVGGISAVVPNIKGRAFVTGIKTFVVDPEDPFTQGFGVGYAADAAQPVY